jgi:histidine phosphotransferase ChpT
MPDVTGLLGALIGSRICHDLISPVGAIQNGLELLMLEGRGGPELALIEESVANASARIRFMRVAFGLASPGQTIGRREIVGILDDLARGGRIRYDWTTRDDCDRAAVQEIFLAALCLEAAMPRGGRISIARDNGNWAVSADADLSRPDPALWQMLKGERGLAETVQPAHVQFLLLSMLLEARGATAEVTEGDGTVTLAFHA